MDLHSNQRQSSYVADISQLIHSSFWYKFLRDSGWVEAIC